MSQEHSVLRDFLKYNNLRMTPQRRTILQVFLETTGHIEVEDIYQKALEIDETIGISTVFRTMNLLTKCGLASENIISNGKRVFEKVFRRGHHDHLVCTECHKVVEFQHPMIEQFQQEVALNHQFDMQSHRMTLYGVCRKCLMNPPKN